MSASLSFFLLSESVVSRAVRQGSFTALLLSGAQMSYSFYGPSGEASGLQPEHARSRTLTHVLNRLPNLQTECF